VKQHSQSLSKLRGSVHFEVDTYAPMPRSRREGGFTSRLLAFGRSPLGWVGKIPAPCGSWLSRTLRGYESASTSITLSSMNQNLCRRLMPCPKFGRSSPTTEAAAPATFCLVHLQVVGREQMAIAADIGYGHGLEDTFQGKAHYMSFGCFKACPRYHLQRIAPSCSGLPH
jgi:hypothetical protein